MDPETPVWPIFQLVVECFPKLVQIDRETDPETPG